MKAGRAAQSRKDVEEYTGLHADHRAQGRNHVEENGFGHQVDSALVKSNWIWYTTQQSET